MDGKMDAADQKKSEIGPKKSTYLSLPIYASTSV